MNNINSIIAEIKKRPRVVIGVIGGIIIIILVFILVDLLKPNPYGKEIRIDNLSSTYTNMPQNQKNRIYNGLYDVVKMNVPEGYEIPDSGAVVRNGTSKQEFNEETNIYTGEFIVDIASIKQSYRVWFEWSPYDKNPYLGGYTVVVTCLPQDLQKYNSWVCKSLFGAEPEWENSYQLEYTFGAKTSLVVVDVLSDFLVAEFPESGEYKVAIDEASLKREYQQPDLTYSFKMALNQDDVFKVIVRMDDLYGNDYVAIYVSGDEVQKGFILKGDEGLAVDLSGWLVGLSGDAQLSIEELSLSEVTE
jgi:hypothetical protein